MKLFQKIWRYVSASTMYACTLFLLLQIDVHTMMHFKFVRSCTNSKPTNDTLAVMFYSTLLKELKMAEVVVSVLESPYTLVQKSGVPLPVCICMQGKGLQLNWECPVDS